MNGRKFGASGRARFLALKSAFVKRFLPLVFLLGHLAVCRADAVRLQINGPDGKPVAGAKVRVLESSGYWFRRKTVASLDLTSDAAGNVRFQSKKTPRDLKQIAAMKTEPQSQILVRVRAPGLAVGSAFLHAGDNSLVIGKAQIFEGTALDEAQHPVAGAALLVTSVAGEGQSGYPNTLELRAVSDASGHFRFEAMPLKGTVSILVEDPKWKRETFQLDLTKAAPPLFLERGATIKGRLLKPDGTPAANVRFFAGDLDHQPTTRADGTFEATGLGEMGVYLQIIDRDQKLPFVVVPKSVGALKAGQVRDIGDWKTRRGIHLKGRIVEGGTRKPVMGAELEAIGRDGDAQGTTNAGGAFDIVTAPNVLNLFIKAPGFVPLFKRGVGEAAGGVLDAGTISVERGKRASGVALDEGGNAIAFRQILVHNKNNMTGGEWQQTDAAGRFSFDGLGAGDYTLRGDTFKITQGGAFSVGDGPIAPLRVVGGAVPAIAKVGASQVVQGRALDLDDVPVAGAKIEMRWRNAGAGWQDQTAISQSDGTFSARFGIETGGKLVILGARRPGFSAAGSLITAQDGHWRVETTFQPRGMSLRGRVVNAAGDPVAGAFVGTRDGVELPVATDASGHFALPDAPMRGVTLLVSDGPSLAQFEVKNKLVEITLPAAPPAFDKSALAESVLANAQLGYDWKDAWDTLGAARIEALAGRADATTATKDVMWSQFLNLLARREPKTFLARETELRAQTSGVNRAVFEHLALLSCAVAGDQTQREAVRIWLQDQQKERRGISEQTVSELLDVAEIGARLEPEGGAMWLDYAGQILSQLPDNGGEHAWYWGKTLARVEKDAPFSFGSDWKPRLQIMLLDSAMDFYKQSGDLQNARRAWQKSQQLARQSAKNPAADPKPRESSWKTSDLVGHTTNGYIALLSRTDPRAAIAMVSSLDAYHQGQLRAVIARSAAKLGQFDLAKTAIEAIFKTRRGDIELCSRAARIAQDFDPIYASTLWPRVSPPARAPQAGEEHGPRWSVAPLAVARASSAPGQSRILIEREWFLRLDLAPDDDPDDFFDERGLNLAGLVEAMAHVWPPRALEMLDKIHERKNLRAQTQTDIALALLGP